MLPPGLETPRQVKAYYEDRYNAFIDSGDYLPFIYPWATLGAAVVLVYLLFDHRKSPSLQALRFPAFGVLVAFSAWSVLNMKARSAPAAYGVGLISAWGTLWTSSIMFFNDCQANFKRLERADTEALQKAVAAAEADGDVNGSLPVAAKKLAKKSALLSSEGYATQSPAQRKGPVFWQSYPSQPFVARLDWVADAFCSFRGVGWSFQANGIPKPPKHIELQLLGYDVDSNSSSDPVKTVSHTGIVRLSSREALLRYVAPRIVLGAAALDVIKCLMHHDAYFWGYMDAVPPAWLPMAISRSAILVRSYRLLLSFLGITIALNTIFLLGPIFFCFILGPSRLGLRGEAFMNPVNFFGNMSLVFKKGLAGWWGGFWHQTFRYAFEAPGSRLLETLGIEKKSQAGKLIGLFVAFTLSGCLHACGSYTQLGETRPILGPFRFFITQAVGIVVQMFAAQQLKARGASAKIPGFVRQLGNFAFTIVWLYWTAPLLVDDFAKGGVWLYEPLIISPLQMLGLGAKDDNGWDLWYGLVFWRNGKGWLDTGLAF
ncbi:putative Wax synthase domain-containing protein [Septoria linicola]|nr:putative Wax synthase domain-containing protein [Septoria linicola]